MQRGGPTGQGHGVRDPDATGQIRFEGVDVGPKRCDPARVEGIEDAAALLVADVGRRQVDAAHAGTAGTRRQRAARAGHDHDHDAGREHRPATGSGEARGARQRPAPRRHSTTSAPT